MTRLWFDTQSRSVIWPLTSTLPLMSSCSSWDVHCLTVKGYYTLLKKRWWLIKGSKVTRVELVNQLITATPSERTISVGFLNVTRSDKLYWSHAGKLKEKAAISYIFITVDKPAMYWSAYKYCEISSSFKDPAQPSSAHTGDGRCVTCVGVSRLFDWHLSLCCWSVCSLLSSDFFL